MKECKLPESSDIVSTHACLSMLLLKLIGGKRLSHIEAYEKSRDYEFLMEKVWCGADILRREEANEINKFVEYWKRLKGNVAETLVFDCKFTTYGTLDNLARACHYIMRDQVPYDPAKISH